MTSTCGRGYGGEEMSEEKCRSCPSALLIRPSSSASQRSSCTRAIDPHSTQPSIPSSHACTAPLSRACAGVRRVSSLQISDDHRSSASASVSPPKPPARRCSAEAVVPCVDVKAVHCQRRAYEELHDRLDNRVVHCVICSSTIAELLHDSNWILRVVQHPYRVDVTPAVEFQVWFLPSAAEVRSQIEVVQNDVPERCHLECAVSVVKWP